MRKIIIFITVFLFIININSFGDRRNYVWTYQYQTMPKNETEMEFYQTTRLNKIDSWEYRIEVEHGLTDYWDFSVYQIFAQEERKSLSWDAFQLRTRYKLGEVGQWLFDPLLYFEYNRKIDTKKQNKFETKLILAKTVSKFNLALNPVYEYFFGPGMKHEIGLDFGSSWEFSPKFILGFESTFRIEFEHSEKEIGSYIGPTLSFASGEWWYAVGTGFGITEDSDNARVRFLMGIIF